MDHDEGADMGSYLVRLSKRIASLEITANELDDLTVVKANEIQKKGDDFREEIQNLNKEISEIRKGVSDLSVSMTALLETFKKIARQESLERVNRKVDDWNPISLVTRNHLQRELKKIK